MKHLHYPFPGPLFVFGAVRHSHLWFLAMYFLKTPYSYCGVSHHTDYNGFTEGDV